ncbi:MAG: ABC transporter substrate-binding protein, partial [Tannerella sp.]|nr:ABC transporter substrate-binding protein [Tannerella sp.]
MKQCFYILFCLAFACNVGQNSSSSKDDAIIIEKSDSIRYAQGFEVTEYEGYTKIEVRDPWHEGKLLQRYILIPRSRTLPASLPKGTIIRTPIRRAVVYSAVHARAIVELGSADDIIGVCESRYILSEEIRRRVAQGSITDCGESASPNVEKMIAMETEVIFASAFNNSGYGAVEKTDIPIMELADYMETDPLGRAEWIKFIGLLTGRASLADSLFRRTEANYLRIKSMAQDARKRPTLLPGMNYGSTWYVPAGDSYMAHLYADAAADYLFSYLKGTGNAPLSFETVLERAIHADVWLIMYYSPKAMTYYTLGADFSSYRMFDAFRQRHIHACNTNFSLYYEEAPLHPD